jgi:flagellar biosynthesis activator protein FlaF
MRSAAQIYGKVAKETASPRELEANLLLRAAARFQMIRDSGFGSDSEFDDALLFNRKLWSVFLTSVTQSDNPLPANVRQNIANLGLFVMNRTVALAADRRPEGLNPLILINRELAAGLLGRA